MSGIPIVFGETVVTQARNVDSGQPKERPRVAGYELLAKLGRGAVGIVYKARQLSVGRTVALKLLDPKYTRDKKYVGRFLREARSLANLNHVNIVEGIDAGKAPEGYYYFAMEYVEGETVKEFLARDRIIPEAKAIDIAVQIARALQHAEKIKLVHRDIKPENIMLTNDGVAKLADLGLAKSVVEDVSLTLAGQAMGTPLYISPEQAQGKDTVDVRSDIYSLGATLYHMTTGFPAFAGENPTVIMLKHINEEAPPPRRANPNLSQGFSQLVEKMMAKDQADRYQTAAELLDELSALAAGRTPDLASEHARRKTAAASGAPTPVTESPNRFVRLLAAGVLTLAAAAGLYFVFLYEPPAKPHDPGTGDPRNPAVWKREKTAAMIYHDALEFEERGKLEEARKTYEDLAANFPDTSRAAAAAERAEALSRQLAAVRRAQAEKQAYQQLTQEVQAAKNQQDYARAIELAKAFCTEDHTENIKKNADALLQELRDERKLLGQGLHEKAGALIAASEYAEAKQALEKLNHLGYTAWYNDGMAAIGAAIKQQADRVADAHAGFWLKFAEDLRETGPDAARARADEALEAPGLGPEKSEIEWDRRLLGHLKRIDRDALAGLKALDGKEFPLGGKNPVPIRNVADITFDKIVSGTRIPCKFGSLSSEERFRLAGHYWKIVGRAGGSPAAAYYLCVAFDPDAAREAAGRLPEEDARRFMARIELLIPEAEARKQLDRATEADKKGEWKQVLAVCEEFKSKYGRTLIAKRNREKLDDLYGRSELRRCEVAVPKHFRGKVQHLKSGRWQFYWNFAAKEQLEDFHLGEVPQIDGDGAKEPKVVNGVLLLKGIDVVAPVFFKGAPLEIEYKLRLLEERASHGYGRVLIFPQARKGPNDLWEFAFCHGNLLLKDSPDFFRSLYTLGGGADCWRQPCSKTKLDRKRPHKVRVEITKSFARVSFDGYRAYNSIAVRLPGGEPDAAALPDLSRLYQVQFSGWHPDDTWAFDDITIVGPADPAWLKAIADEQER